MKFATSSCICVFALLSSVTQAIPLSWPAKALAVRAPQPQSYSVVAVDGGSSTPSAAPTETKTVTNAVTEVHTATILSTIPASPSNSIMTIVDSQTVTMTQVQAPATVTAEPSVTSAAFDNGQWHTTYYFKSTISSVASQNAIVSTPVPTTSIDVSQWAYWSERDGNSAAQ